MSEEAKFAHHTIALEGVSLHYVIAGKGDPVVLLHGWPQTWYEWRRIMPTLAQRYTVIAPDMRGLGDSSRPATGYDKQSIAADIRRLVHKLGFEQILLVGHDWGGPVAYAYACGYPAEVRRLAILDVTIPNETWERIPQITRRGGIWHVAFHSVRDLPEALINGRERIYLSWFYRTAAYNPAAINEADIDEYVRCYSAPGAMRAGFEYYRAIFTDIDHNKENAKNKLKMPVLALGGERGFRSAPLKCMKELADDVRGGVVERSGHWIPEERPDYLLAQLLEFFSPK
jgi:pimeloyl-ACP methyl ester carboxylesterase